MSIEQSLWNAANQLRANSELKSSEYSYPVLGLIFLKFADYKFTILEKKLSSKFSKRNRKIGKEDYLAKGAMYLNNKARFEYLLQLPEGENIGQRVNEAMFFIEKENPDLKDILPKSYNKFSNSLLIELLRLMDGIPNDIEGDVFGKIYENFLGEFAMTEGQKGGEFFTPTSIVKLIVEIIEPYEGRIYDPACGSGGMFVQSAHFVEKHKFNPSKKISIYGQERVGDTVRLNKMNLAVHGLAGDIKQGNAYYEDLHKSINYFDFVMANPPFNVKKVDKEKIKNDPRFSFGIPSSDNANYLWIQIFFNALKKNGRAGFVMSNAANDAPTSELKIRKELIQSKAVDVIIAIGPNFFYTVPLSCTLWFFDKSKRTTNRKNKILFINATKIFKQISNANREFTPDQIEFISNIVRLYRGKKIENKYNGKKKLLEQFANLKYRDVVNLCKVKTLDEISEENWSLSPNRYVGISDDNLSDTELNQKLDNFHAEFTKLVLESRELENKILKFSKLILKKNK